MPEELRRGGSIMVKGGRLPSDAWLAKLNRLWNRADFRAHPARAIGRRIRWRWRWMWTREPWALAHSAGFTVLIPKSGSGALVYYQGLSEPETARFLLDFLKPGMVFLDVGAHFGEYTLMASRQVGESGHVHAFEPQTDICALLERNVALNKAGNVTVNVCAVADRDGETAFWERREPASSSLEATVPGGPDSDVARVVTVPVRSIDAYCDEKGCVPELIKVDVEGAEQLVLRGAARLCSLPAERAPVWVLEYSPSACSRFGDKPENILATLDQFGYRSFTILPDGSVEPMNPSTAREAATRNLVAAKRRLA